MDGDSRRAYCGSMTQLVAVRGDITRSRVDAIVNAANPSLLGGGGVDGAIHAAAGPHLLEACRAVRASLWPEGLPTGRAVATPGFDLPAAWVIHTVGPIHSEYPDGGVELLRSCHRESLQVAHDRGATSIAFPAISCGVYGWRAADAAPIAVAAVLETAAQLRFERVMFVLFNDDTLDAYRQAIAALQPR